MAFKSLLLDIDGVIIRDRQLLNHVRDNCVRYVRNKVPACKQPNRLNDMLFSASGHTARGLRESFGIDTSDFNDFVYDVPVQTRLWDVLSSTEFQKEAAEIHNLTQNGWKVTLFTNSPIKWAGEVAHAISDEIYVQCPDDLLHAPLKPEPEAYNFLKNHTHHTHIFVDDSLRNLYPTKKLPNWKPVHFNEYKSPTPSVSRTFPTIGSIWELCLFVNTVDLEISQA
jgi:FMN phosphatase YigB (HAD superfamily)